MAHLVRVRRARESQVQLGQQPLAVNSLAVARLLIPGSPATDHKVLIGDKGIGLRLMVTEMQLGTATQALLEVAGMAKDHALPVLDWEIQCTMWYVICVGVCTKSS